MFGVWIVVFNFVEVVSVGVCVVYKLCYNNFELGWMMLVLRFGIIDVVFLELGS